VADDAKLVEARQLVRAGMRVVGDRGLKPEASSVPRISLRCTDSAGPRYTTHALDVPPTGYIATANSAVRPAPWVETPGPFPIFCGLAGWADQGPLITAAGAVRLPIAGGRTYGNANQSITLIGSPINLRRSQQG